MVFFLDEDQRVTRERPVQGPCPIPTLGISVNERYPLAHNFRNQMAQNLRNSQGSGLIDPEPLPCVVEPHAKAHHTGRTHTHCEDPMAASLAASAAVLQTSMPGQGRRYAPTRHRGRRP